MQNKIKRPAMIMNNQYTKLAKANRGNILIKMESIINIKADINNLDLNKFLNLSPIFFGCSIGLKK